ncbi:MAG: hypothetical protein ACD_79C00396G0004, partial [uncultured bacterium]
MSAAAISKVYPTSLNDFMKLLKLGLTVSVNCYLPRKMAGFW